MWRSFRVGSAFGIPIKLDLTFLLVLPVFAWLIGAQIGQIVDVLNVVGGGLAKEPLTASPLRWVLGLAAALGLFVGVLLHEFGHALTARRFGYPIDSITLWIFGGVARFTEMPENWKQELAIAVAGPVVSVALGVVGYAVFVALPGVFGGPLTATPVDAVGFVVGYLALLNLALAAFNMLPAFPMDGGRVLRALLARNRSYVQATRTAAEVGKGFAILFGLWGLFNLNVILIGVAFFVYIAAAGEAQQVTVRAAFEGVAVRDIMTPLDDLRTVGPGTSIADLMERMFRERHTGYPVMENGHPVGVVTLEDARDVEPVERDAYTVDDVMTPDLVTIEPDAEAVDALSQMQEHDVGRLLVTRDGELVGLISRTDLMRALDVVQSGAADIAERAVEAR